MDDSTYATQLRNYTNAVRAYGMMETSATGPREMRRWARELRSCALQASAAATALADLDPGSAAGLAWHGEAARWEVLPPGVRVRQGDLVDGVRVKESPSIGPAIQTRWSEEKDITGIGEDPLDGSQRRNRRADDLRDGSEPGGPSQPTDR
jgi:hypothetical protein